MSMTPLPTSALLPPPSVGRQAAEEATLWAILRILRDRGNQVLFDALAETDGVAQSLPNQIAAAVASYLAKNPPAAGKPGADATDAQVAAAVAAYLAKNPPAAGKPGADATDAQVATAVASYLTKNPPAAGKQGPYAASEIGTISFGQSAVAVVAGVRTLRVTGTTTTNTGAYNAKAGDRLLLVPTAIGASYLLGQVTCPADGKLDVTLYGPVLSVAESYTIGARVLKVATA